MIKFLALLVLWSCSSSRIQIKRDREVSFKESKKHLARIHQEHPYTLYCGCSFAKKTVNLESCGYKVYKNHQRAKRIEWEHVVPAHAFGHAFPEWRKGGRKKAASNPEYRRMEADMYNLWPEIGELNGLRSNFSMTDFGENDHRRKEITFGQCRAKIAERKFEPMDMAKGTVARTYMYMDLTYPGKGIIARKNRKLFEAWDKMFPVSTWECKRAKKIELIQKNANSILNKRCPQNGKI